MNASNELARPDWLPADFSTPPTGMHWVHPADGKHSEPEPDRFDCGHWYPIADAIDANPERRNNGCMIYKVGA